MLQARSYLQALPYKPKVPWEKLFPTANPKGIQVLNHIVIEQKFIASQGSLSS